MKTKSMIPLILAAISLLLSCEKRIYIPEPTGYQLPDKTGNIPLDTTYHLYTRVIYRIQAAFIDQGTPSASGVSLPAALLTNDKTAARDSLSFLSGTRQKESVPIEVEYLFISNTHATAIYISGVADRFRERYSRADFKRNTPNADDFRVFLIGKLLRKGDTVTFYNPDGQQTDNWILNLADHGQAMFVNQIESNASVTLKMCICCAKRWRIIFPSFTKKNGGSFTGRTAKTVPRTHSPTAPLLRSGCRKNKSLPCSFPSRRLAWSIQPGTLSMIPGKYSERVPTGVYYRHLPARPPRSRSARGSC